jgi:hypothetical protein
MAAGRDVTRQLLDQQLANVASGLRELLSPDSDAGRLARWLAQTTQETLQAPIPADTTVGPDGYGYTAEEAYSAKLFGQGVIQLIDAAHGAAMPALDPPLIGTADVPGLAEKFTGVD